MQISGDGITAFDAKILPGFKPKTELSLQWIQTDDGNWHATDRTSSNDLYQSQITVHGYRTDVDQFLEEIYANRAYGTHQFTMSGFDSNEHIFGENIDHTSVTATVIGTPKIQQQDLHYYQLNVDVQLVGEASVAAGVSATLPDFQYLEKGYNANTDEYTVTKLRKYDSSMTYIEKGSDVGLFVGEFNFSFDEWANLREYYRVYRGSNVSISDIAGLSELFGPNRAGSYPYTVKILNLQEKRMFGIDRWIGTVTLAEVI